MGKQDFSESALKAAWEGQEATRVVWPREVEGASVKGPRGSGQALPHNHREETTGEELAETRTAGV